jgi:hypothetical protein
MSSTNSHMGLAQVKGEGATIYDEGYYNLSPRARALTDRFKGITFSDNPDGSIQCECSLYFEHPVSLSCTLNACVVGTGTVDDLLERFAPTSTVLRGSVTQFHDLAADCLEILANAPAGLGGELMDLIGRHRDAKWRIVDAEAPHSLRSAQGGE